MILRPAETGGLLAGGAKVMWSGPLMATDMTRSITYSVPSVAPPPVDEKRAVNWAAPAVLLSAVIS